MQAEIFTLSQAEKHRNAMQDYDLLGYIPLSQSVHVSNIQAHLRFCHFCSKLGYESPFAVQEILDTEGLTYFELLLKLNITWDETYKKAL